MTSDKNSVPSFDQMIKPTLEALKELGGVAKNDSIDQKVIEIMNLPEDIVTIPHKNGNCAEVSYRIGWARTYLKKYGLLSNPSRGRWELTEQFDGNIESVDTKQIVSSVIRQSLRNFQNSDMANLDSYETFRHAVAKGLEEYAGSRNRSIETGDGCAPYDAFLPQGLGLTDDRIPTYVEIKYIPNGRAEKDYYASVVEQASELFSQRQEGLQLLIIFGANILADFKEELCQRSKPAKLVIWDYDDFTRLVKDRDTEVNAEELINPRRKWLKDKLSHQSPPQEVKEEKKRLIKELQNAYREQNVALFLGAGVSTSAGIPLWSELIHNLLFRMINEYFVDWNLPPNDLKAITRLADQNKENSPLMQMRYIRTAIDEDEYYNLVRDVLYANQPRYRTALLDAIVNISTPRRTHPGVKSIVTYNFDNLLEKNLAEKQVDHQIIYRENDMPDIRKLSIYHVHGFLPADSDSETIRDSGLVFSEEDYHRVYRDAYCWSNLVQLNTFRDSSCLFIGCSLTDPNTRRLLDVAARSEEKPRHFAIMATKEIVSPKRCKDKLSERYCSIDLKIRELYYQSLGINIIWVDHYDEIPEILNSLATS